MWVVLPGGCARSRRPGAVVSAEIGQSGRVGGSDFEVIGETNGVNCDDDHSGVVTMFKTGLQYNFTQVISPFFNAGYHKTFFNTEKTSMSVNGFEIDLGVRFYLGGNRDYENGY